jgi:hypothetical protein
MSRVTIVTVSDGDTNDVAVINPAFTSWNSATAAIDGTNVREEGIGRRNLDFATDIFHKSWQANFAGANTVALPASYGASPIVRGTSVELSYDTAGYSTPIVRCSFEYTTPVIPSGGHKLELYTKLMHYDSSWGNISPVGERKHAMGLVDEGIFGQTMLLNSVSGDFASGKVGLFAWVNKIGGTGTVLIQNIVISIDAYAG